MASVWGRRPGWGTSGKGGRGGGGSGREAAGAAGGRLPGRLCVAPTPLYTPNHLDLTNETSLYLTTECLISRKRQPRQMANSNYPERVHCSIGTDVRPIHPMPPSGE